MNVDNKFSPVTIHRPRIRTVERRLLDDDGNDDRYTTMFCAS